jgi:uncharacterized glyoxalase superfamily protein PhnB
VDEKADARYSTFISSVTYQRPKDALAWLERAFGFQTTMLIEGPGGDDSRIHAEMVFEGAILFVGGEWNPQTRSPKSLGGCGTQSLQVRLAADLDAHCERARAAGAEIVQEPGDQFYGERTYRARDPEGHVWTFFQTLRLMSIAEMEAAGSVEIKPGL